MTSLPLVRLSLAGVDYYSGQSVSNSHRANTNAITIVVYRTLSDTTDGKLNLAQAFSFSPTK